MKKMLVLALVAVVGLVFATGVYAYKGHCQGQGPGQGKEVDISAFKNFQKDTLPLRDEMAVKRMELRNESLKEKPNREKIATLKKEMVDLKTKIQASAEKNGLPAMGKGHGMMGRMGSCDGQGQGRGHGRGMMGKDGCGGQGGHGHGTMGQGGRGAGNCPNS